MPLEIESEASVVVDLVNDLNRHESEIGLVIDETRHLMQRLADCSLSFGPRKTNFLPMP